MTDTLKVGDTVYEFDPNRRRYAQGSNGPPIYREHFRPVEIIGETAKTWLIGTRKGEHFNKKTMCSPMTAWGQTRFYTAADMELDVWARSARSGIIERIRRDNRLLKKVAELIDQ